MKNYDLYDNINYVKNIYNSIENIEEKGEIAVFKSYNIKECIKNLE